MVELALLLFGYKKKSTCTIHTKVVALHCSMVWSNVSLDKNLIVRKASEHCSLSIMNTKVSILDAIYKFDFTQV